MPSMDRNAKDVVRLRRNAQRQRRGDGTGDIKTDGATLALAGGALGVKAGGVGTSQLANGGVTLAKLGALTTKGDLLGYDTAHNRLPVGPNGYVLTADSTTSAGISWAEAKRLMAKNFRQASRVLPDEVAMSSPPTIQAPTAAGANSGTFYPATSGSTLLANTFWYEKAGVVVDANPNYIKRNNVTSASTTSAFEVSWMFEGADCEVAFKAANPHVQYLVNDQPAGAVQAGIFGVGNNWFQRLTFATRAVRKIAVRGANDFKFSYARGASSTDTLWLPTVPPKVKAVVLGDSFTEPTVMDNPASAGYGFNGWADYLGRVLGWETWPSGSGGTGYTTNGGVSGRFTFAGRYASDVTAFNPDVVVIAGGLNDRNNYSSGAGCSPCGQAGFLAALASLQTLMAATTTAKLFVILGPWRTLGNTSSDTVLTSIGTDLAAWVASNTTAALPWIFVDPKTWLTGSGSVNAPAANGNNDYFMGTDGTHPSTYGHYYRAYRVASEIIRQLA